ncbi:MAG: antitoxin [Acidobacteria bacterium]|nr:antitoxin [Acidobacteriota bacterium]
MRTTLNLDDDALGLAKNYADSRDLPLGRAVSELIRKGSTVTLPTQTVNGLLVFDLPADSPRVTTRHIKDLEAESY